MSGHNKPSPGQVIRSADYWDHLEHDGAIDGKDIYKLLSAEQLLYKESASEYFIREGIKGKPTTYSSFAAALQAGFDNGRSVCLMPISTGYYKLSSQVTFGKEKAWYGFGTRSPIKVMDNANIDAILINDTTGEAYDHVVLDGIWMYGNRANQSSGCALRLQNITHSFIRNCWLQDFRDYTIIAENTSGGNTYDGNYLLGTNGSLLYLQGADDIVSSNYIGYATNYGVYLKGNRSRVGLNHIWQTNEAGIYASSNLHTISLNIIEKVPKYGIYLNGHTNIVSENHIEVEGGVAPTHGIIGTQYAKWCHLINNQIVGATTTAMLLPSGADDNIITNNILRSNPLGLSLASDNNLVELNKFLSCTNKISASGTSGNIFRNNPGFNPLGKLTYPFNTTNDTVGYPTGTSNTVQPSTDYEVVGVDIVISSTDSGNTDCAIQIKDPNGNSINPTPLSTLDAYYIPVGYKINWGAFTGAAPTIVVCGN